MSGSQSSSVRYSFVGDFFQIWIGWVARVGGLMSLVDQRVTCRETGGADGWSGHHIDTNDDRPSFLPDLFQNVILAGITESEQQLTLIGVFQVPGLTTAFLNDASSFGRFTFLFLLEFLSSFLTQQQLHKSQGVRSVHGVLVKAETTYSQFLLSFGCHETFLGLLSCRRLFQPLTDFGLLPVDFGLLCLEGLKVSTVSLVPHFKKVTCTMDNLQHRRLLSSAMCQPPQNVEDRKQKKNRKWLEVRRYGRYCVTADDQLKSNSELVKMLGLTAAMAGSTTGAALAAGFGGSSSSSSSSSSSEVLYVQLAENRVCQSIHGIIKPQVRSLVK